jgi:hypothetical protein
MPRYPHDPELPDLPRLPPAPQQEVPVFNLELLLRTAGSGECRARLANLMIAPARANSPREAIADLVTRAKALIADCLARDRAIPWIEPSDPPFENETRMLVPIHL